MSESWSLLKKISFLSLFTYVFLYANSTQFILTKYFEKLWQKVVPWFASLTGNDEVKFIEMTGSGDTTFDYYMVFFFLCLSLLIGPIIYLIGKKINYPKGTNWLMVILRYFLAYNMLMYGYAKIFCLQFGPIGEYALDSTYGNGSPMGLLWNFMGYSQGYTMFTGFLEFIGGVLLLSRRTQTIGALTTFGVMLNVFMLNMCYDVPVKLL